MFYAFSIQDLGEGTRVCTHGHAHAQQIRFWLIGGMNFKQS